ncbi:hypothetical protein GOBAR_AA09164 [Gossypium barbadense]|uniref:Uncharacterized protein n=1 Tax=Gossypium barbadense TaxID=3634 RepID=A0A2P5Y7D6_GOSBA|nr:hypothetical protein GOBAR_AA09164 [Gossypium barbadense]
MSQISLLHSLMNHTSSAKGRPGKRTTEAVLLSHASRILPYRGGYRSAHLALVFLPAFREVAAISHCVFRSGVTRFPGVLDPTLGIDVCSRVGLLLLLPERVPESRLLIIYLLREVSTSPDMVAFLDIHSCPKSHVEQ